HVRRPRADVLNHRARTPRLDRRHRWTAPDGLGPPGAERAVCWRQGAASMSGKVAVVTGASSGFGHLAARRLAERGFTVFGTSRQKRADENGVQMLELDVRSSASIDDCVRTVLARAGRIDVLVNNAGEAHASVAEETSLEDAMRVF